MSYEIPDFDEIDSPPCPRITVTSNRLLEDMRGLREWIILQLERLRYKVSMEDLEALPVPEPIPADTVWDNISVMDKYRSMVMMRQVRQTWDKIIRDHETDWSHPVSVKKQLLTVESACNILKEAFVSPEYREMQEHKVFEAHLAYMKKLNAFYDDRLGQTFDDDDPYGLIPDNDDDNDDENDE